ncbi:MAG: DUF2283 domain-containing protein [Nanoarchaeota archaeon]|nr:DUF2283 domain-containing protein [Nanoarchaeota archaeon]
MKGRHLEAKGKGEYTYDYANDMLLFKIKNRDYLKSLDFDNLIVDIDKEGFITGLRIFDASKIFNIPKLALKNIKSWRFNASIEDKKVTIQLEFIPILRNKPLIKQGQNLVREAIGSKVSNSEVLCTVA